MKRNGFTLIEMLIVMLVITVLLLIMLPNVSKHNGVINDKGCDALVKTVESQVQVYKIEHEKVPTLGELKAGGYVREDIACPDGQAIGIDSSGKVTVSE